MAFVSPLIFISLDVGQQIANKFRFFVTKILAFFPLLKYDLKILGNIEAEAYVAANFISSLIISLFFSILIFVASKTMADPTKVNVFGPIVIFAIFFIIFFFNMLYPGIKVRTFAIKMDRDLSYALKDLLVQIESGISLYEAMVNIAHSNYGGISQELNTVVTEISAGTPESLALQKMALKTKSDYFRKALWQLISSLESGASIAPAIKTVIETLEAYQRKSVRDYASSLNFIVLIYMLISAAIPSMGVTFLIVLSAFGGLSITESVIIGVIVGSLLAQLAIIGYVNSVRPTIYE
ncbi:MAG: type II secretion system F family protein [Candidatus Micrarchaeota archaeon]